jgi:hypothetical protein
VPPLLLGEKMRHFQDLPLPDQATIVLITLLEDIADGKRTKAGVGYHINGLFGILSDSYDVPAKEAQMVAEKVAKYGIELLPAYRPEDPNGNVEGTDSGSEEAGGAGA